MKLYGNVSLSYGISVDCLDQSNQLLKESPLSKSIIPIANIGNLDMCFHWTEPRVPLHSLILSKFVISLDLNS